MKLLNIVNTIGVSRFVAAQGAQHDNKENSFGRVVKGDEEVLRVNYIPVGQKITTTYSPDPICFCSPPVCGITKLIDCSKLDDLLKETPNGCIDEGSISKSHHSEDQVARFGKKTCNRGGKITKEDSSLSAAIINPETATVSIAGGKTQIHYPKIEKYFNKDKTFFEKVKSYFWRSSKNEL